MPQQTVSREHPFARTSPRNDGAPSGVHSARVPHRTLLRAETDLQSRLGSPLCRSQLPETTGAAGNGAAAPTRLACGDARTKSGQPAAFGIPRTAAHGSRRCPAASRAPSKRRHHGWWLASHKRCTTKRRASRVYGNLHRYARQTPTQQATAPLTASWLLADETLDFPWRV